MSRNTSLINQAHFHFVHTAMHTYRHCYAWRNNVTGTVGVLCQSGWYGIV